MFSNRISRGKLLDFFAAHWKHVVGHITGLVS
ncbi:hypothetical protein GGD64_008352 [Bradyrhizobium sp. CIR3A]|nr:hypothetical protein [Bradyrhizobium sp. CIR3A]